MCDMKPLKRYKYKTSGGPIPYVKIGKGPVLFLLIGFHSDIDRFHHIIMHFAKHFTVIAPEYPGIGCSATLAGKPYKTAEYARIYMRMIKDLKLSSFVLCGLCYGGIISLRMIKMGLSPQKLLLIETFTSDRMLKLYTYQRVLLPVAKMAFRNRLVKRLFHKAMKSRLLLSSLFYLVFLKERNIPEVVKYQLHLTTMMHPDAYLDAAEEMLNFSLFEPSDRWTIPTVNVFFRTDPQLDSQAALNDINKHFPEHDVVYVDYSEHVPSGPMTQQQVQTTFGPVASVLRQKLRR